MKIFTVKHRVFRALQQSKDHARDIEESVSEAIGLAVRDADVVPMRDIIRSAIEGAVEAGADLADVAQGILAAILREGREHGLAAQEAFEDAARTILQHTERIGADVTAAARGILQGAIRNAKRFGHRASSRVSDAAENVPHAGIDPGTAAPEEVRETFDGKRKRRPAS